jgi:hypothetical protein
MAILKGLADAGQGGKRGHSNMDHWEFNDEIKSAARKRRRLAAKMEIKQELAELEDKERPEAPEASSKSWAFLTG